MKPREVIATIESHGLWLAGKTGGKATQAMKDI